MFVGLMLRGFDYLCLIVFVGLCFELCFVLSLYGILLWDV